MNYQTVEVDLENGTVRARGTETLPAKARALLTIVDRDLPLTDADSQGSWADRLRRFKGIGSGQHTDLSTNKAHLADLGQ